MKSPWNGETGEYELFYRTMSMFPTWNPWNEDGSPAAGWSNQDGNPYYWKDKLTRSTTNRKTSFNIGFALEILPQQLFLNGNSSMYYTDSQFELFEKKYQQIGQAPNTNRNASQTNTKVFQQQHALTLEYKKVLADIISMPWQVVSILIISIRTWKRVFPVLLQMIYLL